MSKGGGAQNASIAGLMHTAVTNLWVTSTQALLRHS